MMGGFLSRILLLAAGYAYPAYECYKTVELNRPEIAQLIFWCQYWILVALVTVFERFGDWTISWLPFYSEAKIAFLVYLWHPKTRGTTYIYETFLRPYISQHENDIDRNLLELRAKAGDVVYTYWQQAATVGQSTFFDVLKYVASQSPPQFSKRPTQQPPNPNSAPVASVPKVKRQASSRASSVAAAVHMFEPAKAAPSVVEAEETTASADTIPHPQTSRAAALPSHEAEEEAAEMDAEDVNGSGEEEAGDGTVETQLEEAIRVSGTSLRKRAAAVAAPADVPDA